MSTQNQPKPSVDVTGEGVVNIVPDQVTVKVRVENTGDNAKALKHQNDIVVNDVLVYVSEMGVEDKHIKTEYIRLSKNYDYKTKTYNFSANQAISIKVIDLEKYSELMNGLLETGINRIDGASFSSSENDTLEILARKRAVENAKQKATEYASVLNQSIGKALYISEFQHTSSPQPMMLRKMSTPNESMGGGGQTIAPGEMEITARVNVSFELN